MVALILGLFSKALIASSFFFLYKERINRSQMSKVVCKASCWDCQDLYIGKTKSRLHDRKTEHFIKAITSNCHESAIADHVTSTGHNLKWDHFDILAKGRSDTHCKIKETLLIRELKPTLNDKVSSEKQLPICKFVSQFLSLLLPPQGFGPEAKTRGGIIGVSA